MTKSKQKIVRQTIQRSVRGEVSKSRKKVTIETRLDAWRNKIKQFMSRRPHRSFKRTYRRDYQRSLKLPGYIAFTRGVVALLWMHRALFLGLAACYVLATIVLVGIASQDLFSQLSATLRDSSGDLLTGGWGAIGQAGLLTLSGATGSFSAQLTDVQQVYSGILLVVLWLTTVWLLRAIMSGAKPRLRDGIYSAGSPLVGMVIIVLLMVVQCLPAALGVIIYSAAMSTSLLSEGAIAMLICIGALLLVVLSVYLLVSSFFAAIIITLPGMYPWRALRSAGDLVTGRRLRILYRLAWMVIVVGLGWIIVMLPIVLVGTGLQNVTWLAWVPLVPIALVVVATISIIFSCAYIYTLYRKVVDDDATPA